MKLPDLKDGEGDIVHSWPPMFGGAYGRGDRFPVGEMGKLVKVEAAKVVHGVEVHVEYEGRTWSGILTWNGEKPSIARVVAVLGGHVGEDLAGLGSVELD